MAYRILIEKIDVVEVIKQEYKQIADYGNPRDKDSYSFSDDKEKKHGGPQYGYVSFPSTEKRTTKVLEQEAEELDIKAVIKAVNGL